MKPQIKRCFFDIVVCIFWLGLVLFLIRGAAQMQRLYPAVSLRYNTPISPQQADAARRYAAGNAGLWPTFWSETGEEIRSAHAGVSGRCLWFSGSGALVCPADFVAGGYPGATEQNGIAISTALADKLWGSAGVVGLEAQILGRFYPVRGVFDSPELLALIGCGESAPPAGWDVVELQSKGENPREEALLYAQASGLGEPDTAIAPTLGAVCALLAGVPLLLVAGWGLGTLLRGLWRALPRGKEVLFFAVALLGALCLPFALERIPAMFVPGAWSDFGFWSRLLGQGQATWREFLLARPRSVDLQAKRLLLQQAAGFAAAVPVSLYVCRRVEPAVGRV